MPESLNIIPVLPAACNSVVLLVAFTINLFDTLLALKSLLKNTVPDASKFPETSTPVEVVSSLVALLYRSETAALEENTAIVSPSCVDIFSSLLRRSRPPVPVSLM